MSDDRRAKDVVRDKDVLAHDTPWKQTTGRLMARYWRRPAGSSAKLWKKVGGDDPFLPPKPERKMLEEHRQVSAAGRFVRIDKHERKKNPGLPGPKKQERQENVPDWVVKLREKAQDRAAKGKKPLQVHTPSALTKAPTVRPASKRNPERPPAQPPPKSAPKRVSKSGRLLPQRPNKSASSTGAPGRPPLLRDHKPDTAAAKPFAEVDGPPDRRPPLIRPEASSGRRPIKRGVAPPGGAPPLIRPGESKADQRRRRPQRPRPKTDRPKTPPGGAPPLVRDFQPQTGPVDPFSQRFGAADAKPRHAQRMRRDVAPPGGAPPLIRDGKQINTPDATPAPAPPTPKAPPTAPSSGDPFDALMSGGPGRTRLKGRAKTPAEDAAPKRRRPVIGGPPPGGSVPLNRQAAPVSSPTVAGKEAPAPLNSPGRPTPPEKTPEKTAKPTAKKAPPTSGKVPSKKSSDPFDALMGSSEGRTRLRSAKTSETTEAPKRRRPVIGGPPPGGSVPLNRNAAPVSSPTTAGKTPPPPRNSPGRPEAPPKSPPPEPRRITNPPMPTPQAPPTTPRKPASSSGGGMDDLFGGGPQEGRVRLGRAKKPKPTD